MEPAGLVQLLGTDQRLDAMRRLVGSVNGRKLRAVCVSDDTLHALVDGLDDPNPQVRWWCVQLLDHIDDVRAIVALAKVLDDPVPRVRRNAAHALSCTGCKPSWDGQLPTGVLDRLQHMATSDENAKVRAQAAAALACVS